MTQVILDIAEYNQLINIREAYEANSIVFYTRHHPVGMGCVRKELVISSESPLPKEILGLKDIEDQQRQIEIHVKLIAHLESTINMLEAKLKAKTKKWWQL